MSVFPRHYPQDVLNYVRNLLKIISFSKNTEVLKHPEIPKHVETSLSAGNSKTRSFLNCFCLGKAAKEELDKLHVTV